VRGWLHPKTVALVGVASGNIAFYLRKEAQGIHPQLATREGLDMATLRDLQEKVNPIISHGKRSPIA
jgi:hypothetical protein